MIEIESVVKMRIKLRNGKQTELIENAKRKNGHTWSKLSDKLKISEQYLKKELRREKRTLSLRLFDCLCELAGKDYQMFIEKRLPQNWGQIKGGLAAPRSLPKNPRLLAYPSKDLAEIIGIMLGDGNVYVNSKHGIYVVRIGGDSRLDREYLMTFVPSLFMKVFGTKASFYFHKRQNELIVYKQSKDLIYTLGAYGLPPGNKVKNNVCIPSWVMDNPTFLKACIRGLADTDGSVCPRTKKHPVPSIWFTSAIPALRRTFEDAFHKLGYHPTKWVQRGTIFQCSLAHSEEVIRYHGDIGFNNPKHENRFLRMCSGGVDRPNLTRKLARGNSYSPLEAVTRVQIPPGAPRDHHGRRTRRA